jgi:hypothetical protein
VLPRRFRSSLAGAPYGPGQLAIERRPISPQVSIHGCTAEKYSNGAAQPLTGTTLSSRASCER